MEVQSGYNVAQGVVDHDVGVPDCVMVVEVVRLVQGLRKAHHEVEEVQEQNEDLLGPVSSFPLLLHLDLQTAR